VIGYRIFVIGAFDEFYGGVRFSEGQYPGRKAHVILPIETRQKLFQDVIDELEQGKTPSCRPILSKNLIVTQAVRVFYQFIFLSQELATHK
jgi:hypothetical protein